MNRQTKVPNGYPAMAALLLVLATFAPAKAQNPQSQNQNDANQTQLTQADQMLGPLNLTPDQIQKIRGINAELRDQRQAANLRLRQAQRALAEAVESPTPNESLIEQRSRDVADAQHPSSTDSGTADQVERDQAAESGPAPWRPATAGKWFGPPT